VRPFIEWLTVPGKSRVPPLVWLALIVGGVLIVGRPWTVPPGPEIVERWLIATPTPGLPQTVGMSEVVGRPVAGEPEDTMGESGPVTVGTLAFSMRHNGVSDIYLLSQGTGKLLRMTSGPSEDRDPAWSPDGRYLAFASRRGGGWELYAMEMTSGTLLRLTHTAGYKGAPSWSPDSQWLAYEAATEGVLNIHVLEIATGVSQQLTFDATPQYAPAWSPDGRHIAFTGIEGRGREIFVLALDTGAVANVTRTPDQDEDSAAWSPDGKLLAYAAGAPGAEMLWLLPFDAALLSVVGGSGSAEGEGAVELRPQRFGIGGAPAWSPDGQALAFVARQGGRSYVVAADRRGWGLTQEGYSSTDSIGRPAWRADGLPVELEAHLERQGTTASAPLYTELLLTQADASTGATGRYQLVPLPNVNGSNTAERLSDRVNDSFNALRDRVKVETGWDYLTILGDSWRPMNHTPRPGQGRISWHVCGRAIDINQGFLRTGDIELVREDLGGVTYWRVFIRARVQDGSLGEPLRVTPWDLNARAKGGLATAQGGELKAIPPGYYVDFTTLALDYGWERRNALSNWRNSYFDVEWWHFQKTEGLSWYGCMLEVYDEAAVIESYGALPWWTKRPEWEIQGLP
jgi:TolB protein